MTEPFLSIITPVWDTQAWMLQACIESVLNQTDDDFELILVDDGSSDETTVGVLDSYMSNPKITIVKRDVQGGIVAATNEGIACARGKYIGFLDHDDELTPDAVEIVRAHVVDNIDPDFLYSDEDHIDENGEYFDPIYKPHWSPERLRSQNYICHFSVYKKTFLDKLGGLRSGFDGSQDYDLVLRCLENTDDIVHIRHILYHWRNHPLSVSSGTTVKSYAYENAIKSLTQHSERSGWTAKVVQTRPEGVYEIRKVLEPEPLISIIIPTAFTRKMVKGRKVFLLENAIKSVMDNSTYRNIEFIIITNVSVRQEDRIVIEQITGEKGLILEKPGPFNFSAQCNYAATFARGSHLFILNDDTQMIDPDSLRNMAGFFNDPQVGIVGALLLFETDMVQHAGIVMATSGPTNYLSGFASNDINNSLALFCSREVSATTFACALIDRNVYFDVGGMCEGLPNSYNDVDCCSKVVSLGKKIVWTPQAKFYHFESASRDAEVKKYELGKVWDRWGHIMRDDPYIHPHLALVNHALIPAPNAVFD